VLHHFINALAAVWTFQVRSGLVETDADGSLNLIIWHCTLRGKVGYVLPCTGVTITPQIAANFHRQFNYNSADKYGTCTGESSLILDKYEGVQ
jgi:hypothetical protein